MTERDIVELLRCISIPFTAKPVVERAADEIERLRKERDEARAALAKALDSAPILAKFHTKFGFDLEDFIAHYDEWKAKVRALKNRTP
jgi:hypothetical protein